MKAVLAASALLGRLQDEPGAGLAGKVLDAAAISPINWSEFVQKARQPGAAGGGRGAG